MSTSESKEEEHHVHFEEAVNKDDFESDNSIKYQKATSGINVHLGFLQVNHRYRINLNIPDVLLSEFSKDKTTLSLTTDPESIPNIHCKLTEFKENSSETKSRYEAEIGNKIMESTSVISILDILELAHSLRQEQLSIANERNSYIKLNEKLKESTSNTSQNAWICAQQRQNLNNLILAKPDSRPSSCCLKAIRLENVKFVDAYNSSLKYEHLPQYIELLNFLHQSPQLLAQCLAVADDLPSLRLPNSNASKSEQIDSIVQVISAGIYGNSIHGKDVEMMLKLLEKLLQLLISAHESPSRMLRVNSSSFARLYHKFHESSLSAKLFLTAALHEPIMSVLIDDDFMLDTDPVKAMACMHPKEKFKRFGKEDDPEFAEYVRKFHDETVNKLFTLALQFIKSLCRNWIIFPSTIRWLMQTMFKLLQQKNFDRKTINEILTDMVFGHFICPAIVSPDLYGISDAPISENARFNLIQIGQVLQMLALVRNREVDGKFVELFRRFDQNVVSLLMEQLLENSYEISEMGLSHQLPTLYNIGRNSILITHIELNLLIQFLRQTCENNEENSEENNLKLRRILENLPRPEEPEVVNGDVSPSKKSGMISNLGKQTKNKIAKTMSLNVPATSALSLNGGSFDDNDLGTSSSNSGSNRSSNDDLDRVLIIPLTSRHEDNMALMSEEEVLNMNSIQETDTGSLTEKNVEELSRRNEESDNIGANGGHRKEKHTRFSLNHDDVSIGNTSDNLEAVSEAPSNHSVASSLDLEENNDNDNLSDMVSANVSGRGTPNISGRDTPSSQVIDGGEVQQIPTPQMAKILNKTRSDIEDKFCKFEIKKLLEGDETISIISDTWSTDVLASDSENIESNDRNFSTPLIPTNVILPEHNFQLSGLNQRGNLDVSETQSESAWSTDVLASDSEKMTEVDTDDNQSITARSDITDTPRDQEVPNRTPDSPFFAPRVPNIHFRPIDASNLTPRTPESSPFSIRSYDESPRLLVELGLNRSSTDDAGASRFHPRGQRNICGGMNHEQGAVGGIGASSRSSNYLNFVNNTPNYLATVQPRPIRQNSSESQTSTQSEHDKYNQRRKPKEFIEPSQSLSVFRVSDPNLENFSNHVQEPKIIKSSLNLINPFSSSLSNCSDVSDLLNLSMEGTSGIDANANANVKSLTMAHEDLNSSEMAVEHRRLSSEQRQANFDSRRNGMVDLLGNMTPEVMIPNGSCLIPISQGSLTDDVKTQQNAQKAASDLKAAELLEFDYVINKTEHLKLNEANGGIALSGGKINGTTPKSGKSTGAIPKSISFDSSADKVEKSNRNAVHRRSDIKSSVPVQSSTGIFSRIRQGIKNRRGNKTRHSVEELLPVDLLNGLSQNEIFGMNGGGQINNGTLETSDDILAKYRRKPSSSSDAANSDSTGSNNSSSFKTQNSDNENRLSNIMLNPETDYFLNAKRKLRLVLSSSDCHACDVRNNNVSTISPLLTYLQIQLAQALNQQNLQQISYVSEVLRCLNSLDAAAHYKLVEDLQKDVLNRQSYLQYLVRLRQDLLSIIATINNFEMRLQNDRETCNKHLVMVCVRLFLEKREQMIYVFQQEFNGKLVMDEKLELMEEYMGTLMDDLSSDGILQDMADWQLVEARGCVERILLQRLYRQVMFPNDDVDISRDQVLHEHIRKLARVITPSHSSLRIPQRYLNEAPWPFAQKQIAYISAYKTPKEKVQCIIKCIRSIMNLLSMASERVPSADDLIPVLIYVIIKANPPYLLSTIQYVDCFIGKQLAGEESYWWCQFEAAIAFIKSMEYNSE